MKAITPNISRPAFQRIGLCLSLAFSLLPFSGRATDELWLNTGTLTFPPQIDATTFVNSGTLSFGSTLPFESANTRNYTNSGTMISSPGWYFDTAPSGTGERMAADSFVNLNGGTVESIDPGGFIFISVGGFGGGSSSSPSYLWISASNVVNKGTVTVGGNGWLNVIGTNVNLARGAIGVTTLQPQGSFIINQTNYVNDVGISDIWWGQTNGLGFDSSSVWDGSTAVAPPHNVQVGVAGFFNNVSFAVPGAAAYGYSNVIGVQAITLTNMDGSTTNFIMATNIIKQGVFVGVGDPSIMSSAVTFLPSTINTNPFRTVSVQLSVASTNVLTGLPDLTSVYFYDMLASETNRGLYVNAGGNSLPPFVDQRPGNYDVSRVDTRNRFRFGSPGNVVPDANYFFDPETMGETNRFVTGEYAGYAFRVDNLASEPPPTTPGSVTNFPGRVQIYADKLDLRNTRVRGEGEVIINANHLLSSAGAGVDCENLSYNLGATNGNLNVTGLSKLSVIRLKGDIYAWSGLWSNTMTVILTNNYTVTNSTDTNGVITGTNAVPSPLTNTVSVSYHALILDGLNLAARIPVITWDLVTHSTNIVISDSLSVVESLLLDGESFTLDGNLALTSTTLQNTFGQSITTELTEWVYTNAPSLLYFTNNGTLTVPSEAHFGSDRPVPYTDFVNAGSLTAGSVSVNSSYVQNSGTLSSTVGPMQLVGSQALFQNGQTSARGDLNFTFDSLKFNAHQLGASGAINFTVGGSLSDAGPGSGNSFRAQNGFNLFIRPSAGDLLGTAIQDAPPNYVEVDHVWAAEDRGAGVAGYKDNTAIGSLTLRRQSTLPEQAPLFFFTGATGHNGLYVDLLDMTSLGTNFLDMLEIDPSLTIYYAAATLGFTPPNNAAGLPQEPEEFLNAQLGGRLVWVSDFAGPNSSVDVVINGVTVSVNRALRFSKIIDSNGNGLPNYYDPAPFDSNPLVLSASLVQTNQSPAGPVAVSWNAQPQKSYQVEFTTDVLHPSWQPLTQYTHTGTASSTVTIWDTNAPAGAHRFYRVKTSP